MSSPVTNANFLHSKVNRQLQSGLVTVAVVLKILSYLDLVLSDRIEFIALQMQL